MKEGRLRTAAAYIRVSTKDQADHKTSLEDQERAVAAHCAASGLDLVRVFVEAGASGRDEGRAVFQSMIEIASSDDHPFDAIVVHSTSRFFRDAFEFESYRRRLKRAKVTIIAVTQNIEGDDPTVAMTRHILLGFDEYQSAETAKHTRRTMVANARAGFWNGARPPYGFRAYVAELRADKAKMKLEEHPEEAPVVRKMFELYLRGDGSGPMGIRRLIDWLAAQGCNHRGTPFHVSTVQRMLRSEAYCGRYLFNKRDVKANEDRPRDEWVTVPVPAIVSEADFAEAQSQLTRRRRSVTAPRHVTGPMLLTPIARCGQPGCGQALTKLTGKSGQYSYYGCSSRANRATTTCAGVRIPTKKLDDIVLDAVEDQILQPDRLAALLARFLDISDAGVERKKADLTLLRAERTRTEKALANLYDLVEAGLDGPSNRAFAERLSGHQRRIAGLEADIVATERQVDGQSRRITPAIVREVGDLLRERLRVNGSAFAKSYIRLLVDEVLLTPDEVRITGSKSALGRLVVARGDTKNLVPSFDREWCRLGDSNT